MTRHRQAGLSLLEVLLSLSLITVGMVGVNRLVDSYVVDTKNAAVADQLKTSAQAYRAYVRNNYSTILAVATQDKPYLITHTDLSLGNYLPPGSNGRTVHGQTICALVRKNNAGSLEALVVTEGGAALNNLDLGSIVSLTGGSAGALYSDDKADTTPADIVGAQDSWKLPLVQFDNLINHAGKNCSGEGPARVRITEGHPVVALWFENDFTQGSALYRDAVPGAPQLNQMNTPLVMNASQTVGAVCTTPGAIANDGTGALVNCSKLGSNDSPTWNRTASGLYWGDPVSSLDRLPACTAELKASVRVLTYYGGHAATHPSVYICNGSAWAAVGIDLDGNLNVPGSIGTGTLTLKQVAAEDTACTSSQVGTLARSASGEVLVCQQFRSRYPGFGGTDAQIYWTRPNAVSQCHVLPKGASLNLYWVAQAWICAEVDDPVGGPPGSVASNQKWLVTTHAGQGSNPHLSQTARDALSGKLWTRYYKGPRGDGQWTAWVDSSMPSKNNIEFKHCQENQHWTLRYLCELPLDSNSHWVVHVSAKLYAGYETNNWLYVDGVEYSATGDFETDSQETYSHSAVLSKSCGSGPCSVQAELVYGYNGMRNKTVSIMAFRIDAPK